VKEKVDVRWPQGDTDVEMQQIRDNALLNILQYKDVQCIQRHSNFTSPVVSVDNTEDINCRYVVGSLSY